MMMLNKEAKVVRLLQVLMSVHLVVRMLMLMWDPVLSPDLGCSSSASQPTWQKTLTQQDTINSKSLLDVMY